MSEHDRPRLRREVILPGAADRARLAAILAVTAVLASALIDALLGC